MTTTTLDFINEDINIPEEEYLKNIVRHFVNFKGIDLLTEEQFNQEIELRNNLKGRKFKLWSATIFRENLGTRIEYYSSFVYNLPSFFEIITLNNERIYFKKSLIQPKEPRVRTTKKVQKKKKVLKSNSIKESTTKENLIPESL